MCMYVCVCVGKNPHFPHFNVVEILPWKIERLRMTFMANVRYDHVTMFIFYLPLAVFSFSVKSSSFALASTTELVCTILIVVLFISRKHKR